MTDQPAPYLRAIPPAVAGWGRLVHLADEGKPGQTVCGQTLDGANVEGWAAKPPKLPICPKCQGK